MSRAFFLVFYFLLTLNLLISRFVGTFIQTILIRKYKIRKAVAVLGKNITGLRLAKYFENHPKQFSFEGFLDNENSLFVDQQGNLLPGTCEQLKMAADKGVKEVYVSLTADRIGEAGFLFKEAERRCVRLKFVPDFNDSLTSPFQIFHMGDFSIITLRNEPLDNVDSRFRKRLFDVLFSSFVIIFILSWLFPVLALIIKCQSKGPVLFKQLRSGRNNQNFWCYKFRSMRLNEDSDVKQASKNDDRITGIGRIMRRTSLDEFPQFFNVLLGNMSIVGPRPHMLKHTKQYSAIIDKYMVRHYVKPGITGWAQVNGYRGETTNLEQMEKRVEHDIWYMENWSAMLDVKIVFLTILNVFRGEENAY